MGILIQEDYDCDAHVAKVTNQANRILGMIRRNYENTSAKNYKSLVQPHLEYVVQAWRPYKQKHVDQIEKVQRRATKMIRGLDSLPYDQRLQRTNLITLNQ